MDFKAFKTTGEWREMWLKKLSCELTRRGISGHLSRFHYTIINKFLAENPGNPRMIDIDRLVSFVSRQKTDSRPPLIMFYETVARSEEHLAALKSVELTSEDSKQTRSLGTPVTKASPKKRCHDEHNSTHRFTA
jgi:hypothetical protein